MAEIEELYTQLFQTNQDNIIEKNEQINSNDFSMEGDNIELEIDEPPKEPPKEERTVIVQEFKKSLNPNLKIFNFNQLEKLINYFKEFNKQDLIIYQYSIKDFDYSFHEFKGILVQLQNKQLKWSWEYLDLLKSGLTGNIPLAEHLYNYFWENNPFIPFILYLYTDLIDYSKINLNENTLGLPVLINRQHSNFIGENLIENREVFLAIYHNFIDYPIISKFSLFFSWSLNEFILYNIKWKPFAIYGHLISGYLIYKENDSYFIVSPGGQKNKLPDSYSVKKKEFIKINRIPKDFSFNDFQLNNSKEQILIKLSGIEFDSYTLSFWKSKIQYLINGDNNGLLVFKLNDVAIIDNIINYLESYQTGLPNNKSNFIIETFNDKSFSFIDTLILLRYILVIIFTSKKEPIEDFINVVYQIDGKDYNKQLTLLSNISSGSGLILMENCFYYKENICYPHLGLYNWFKKWVEQRNISFPILYLRVLEMTNNSETEINSLHSRINNIGFLNIINYPKKNILRICATFPRCNEIEYRKLILSLLVN
jgi:hypothetical protein